MKKIYTHHEITTRDLNAVVQATLRLSNKTDKKDHYSIGLLNNMIFKFLNDEQIDYIEKKLE